MTGTVSVSRGSGHTDKKVVAHSKRCRRGSLPIATSRRDSAFFNQAASQKNLSPQAIWQSYYRDSCIVALARTGILDALRTDSVSDEFLQQLRSEVVSHRAEEF
jgi:hypothetical protein